MLALVVFAHSSAVALTARVGSALARPRDQRGQATAEYALVLLGAAAVALLLTGWAAKTGRISRLLDTVVDQLLDQVR